MTSHVADYWARTIAWLRMHAATDSIDAFPQTSQAHIDHFEAQTSIRLPQQLLDLYVSLHVSGSSSALPSDSDYDRMAFTPLPLSEVLAEWTSQKELLEIG